MSETGIVYIVGAGPGDPGLITVKGADALRRADVVVYDRLSSPRLLDLAPAGAERVFMGKEPTTPGAFQEEINRTLAAAALDGKTVVRLKGGDPFVFGRGGEEAAALRAAGVRFEVVPGITSAIAVPAYAGVPVTQRGVASAFTVVTGSEDPSKPESALDWDALAKTPGTLVVLMGWKPLAGIVRSLLANGRPPGTPVSVTQWGTLPKQRTVAGTLADIIAKGDEAGLTSPVVTVIGEVAGLRDELRWFDTGPLFGMRVLVTRSQQQASVLAQLLTAEGVEPIELPTIEIAPLEDFGAFDDALERIGSYAWAVFTSTNGVDAAFGRLAEAGRDARWLGAVRVAAIGPATAAALAERGVTADYVPDTFTTSAVAEGFGRFGVAGSPVLLLRADIAPDALPDGLRSHGAEVDSVAAYRTLKPSGAGEQARELLGSGSIDVATFTSSSTVRNLVELLGSDRPLLERVRIASIGPVTSATARELGLDVDVEAREHTVPGLVRALVEATGEQGDEILRPSPKDSA